MLFLFCSLVLGTCQPIPTAQVNDTFSTENGLIPKTFSNCSRWISSGWCDWGWSNELRIYLAGLVLGMSKRHSSVLRADPCTCINLCTGAYFELGFMISQFLKRQPVKIFLCKYAFSLLFLPPPPSSYKSIKVVIEIPSCNTAIPKFKPEEYDNVSWYKMYEMKSRLKQKCESTCISEKKENPNISPPQEILWRENWNLLCLAGLLY